MRSWSAEVRQYALVTFNYWNFTITDGALRMLVVLYFHQLGYSTLAIASLFVFYEFFGVVTNLVGGWLGARLGLNKTMNIGIFLQIIALTLLAVPVGWLTVPWVMAAQALSGIAKDLNKMSAKSAIKNLLPAKQEGRLYHWVAILTGSKNTLKGVGFFIGGLLLTTIGFQSAVLLMACVLQVVFLISLFCLDSRLGKAKNKPKFTQIFSTSFDVNALSAARFFLFGARDIWFVVALPVYLGSAFSWDHKEVGGFLAVWVILYGLVQTLAPYITGKAQGRLPTAMTAFCWVTILTVVTGVLAYSMQLQWHIEWILMGGLFIFGAVFAVNSSMHSYLIVKYASQDGASMDVGFYYMSNAGGRLIGTLLSGLIFHWAGLIACLWVSFALLFVSSVISAFIVKRHNKTLSFSE